MESILKDKKGLFSMYGYLTTECFDLISKKRFLCKLKKVQMHQIISWDFVLELKIFNKLHINIPTLLKDTIMFHFFYILMQL